MNQTPYRYADLLTAAHTRFGRVKEERAAFESPASSTAVATAISSSSRAVLLSAGPSAGARWSTS